MKKLLFSLLVLTLISSACSKNKPISAPQSNSASVPNKAVTVAPTKTSPQPSNTELQTFNGFETRDQDIIIQYPQNWEILFQSGSSISLADPQKQDQQFLTFSIFKNKPAQLPSYLASSPQVGKLQFLYGVRADKFVAQKPDGSPVVLLRFSDGADNFTVETSPELLSTLGSYLKESSFDNSVPTGSAAQSFWLNNNQIYDIAENGYYSNWRGSVANGKLTILIGDGFKVTFPGKVDALDFFDLYSYPMFFYNKAEVGLKLAYPNNGYSVSKVKYSCDTRITSEYSEPKDFYYCQTNNVDEVSEYEFTGGSAIGFGTGGGSGFGWTKVYAKHLNGKDVFVTLNLGGNELDSSGTLEAAMEPNYCNQFKDSYDCSPEQLEHYKNILSKAYLDTLIQRPNNEQSIMDTDSFVASLEGVSK